MCLRIGCRLRRDGYNAGCVFFFFWLLRDPGVGLDRGFVCMALDGGVYFAFLDGRDTCLGTCWLDWGVENMFVRWFGARWRSSIQHRGFV